MNLAINNLLLLWLQRQLSIKQWALCTWRLCTAWPFEQHLEWSPWTFKCGSKSITKTNPNKKRNFLMLVLFVIWAEHVKTYFFNFQNKSLMIRHFFLQHDHLFFRTYCSYRKLIIFVILKNTHSQFTKKLLLAELL